MRATNNLKRNWQKHKKRHYKNPSNGSDDHTHQCDGYDLLKIYNAVFYSPNTAFTYRIASLIFHDDDPNVRTDKTRNTLGHFVGHSNATRHFFQR